MPKKKTTKNKKSIYRTWEDLKHDKGQQAIYKEIADINAYIQKKAYERSK